MWAAEGFADQVRGPVLSVVLPRLECMSARQEQVTIDAIPALIATPDEGQRNGGLALWMPFLGGAKEIYAPVLDQFAAVGFVAVGIDPRRHGQRADLPASELFPLVMGNFRATMWPILGGTVLDALAVTDWAINEYGLDGSVVAGGVSMGGDIAVALAGIDPRVQRAVGVAATPDWTRPGMTIVDDPASMIEQGEPGRLGAWQYQHLDPITHLDAYRREVEIRFDIGTADTHVPGEAAHRFARLLADTPSATISVVEHAGLDHMGVATSEQITTEASAWLTQP